MFFGTDFGTRRGEKRTQTTLCNLRCLVEEAGVDPCCCHLTNSVLALAKRDRMTGRDDIYRRKEYRRYLVLCGDFHRDWICRHRPALVVLMGTSNIDLRPPWEGVYRDHRELVRTERGQPDVLWMFHPSFRNSNPQFRRSRAPKAEKKRWREEVWKRVVGHLSTYA